MLAGIRLSSGLHICLHRSSRYIYLEMLLLPGVPVWLPRGAVWLTSLGVCVCEMIQGLSNSASSKNMLYFE